MSEFVLNVGGDRGRKAFRECSEFVQGYIEAMFFTEANSDNEELEHATVEDLSDEAWKKITDDCDRFLKSLPKDHRDRTPIDMACYYHPTVDYNETRAGHDFWYSRNGHGTGYWDRDLGRIGQDLHQRTRAFGSVYLYRGDDGELYIM